MKKVLGIAVVILVAGLVLNTMLGGFKQIDLELKKVDNYHIYGQSFSGRYDSDELAELVEEVRELVQSDEMEGDLVIVNYMNERQEKRGDVEQFVGILGQRNQPFNEIEGFEERVIITSQVIEAQIDITKLTMPSPEKVKNKADELAAEMGLNLMKLSIEQYADQKLIIRFPVQ